MAICMFIGKKESPGVGHRSKDGEISSVIEGEVEGRDCHTARHTALLQWQTSSVGLHGPQRRPDALVGIKESVLGFSSGRKWSGHSPNWNTAPLTLCDPFP